MNNFCWMLIGVIIGAILTQIVNYLRSAHGTLKIDHSDSNKDVYRLVIDDLEELSKKNYVFLEIDHNADLSQK